MITEQEVRNDLRNWRKQERAINVCIEAQSRMQRQAELLKGYGLKDELRKVEAQIESLHIEKLIVEAQSKREMYMNAIEQLECIDRIVVIENIINSKPYHKIAEETSYAIDTIRWRAKRVTKKICAIINKQRVIDR